MTPPPRVGGMTPPPEVVRELQEKVLVAQHLIETLPDRLEPHLAQWKQRLQDLHEGETVRFFDCPWPHPYLDYELRLESCTESVVAFQSEDREGDTHTFNFPWLFITDRQEWERQAVTAREARRAETRKLAEAMRDATGHRATCHCQCRGGA